VQQARSSSEIRIALPSAVFGFEAAKRAAYSFMKRATVVFEDGSEGLTLIVSPLEPSADLELLERDFRRELLDQDLRMNLEARTEPIRTAILGLAFSRTGLQNE